MMEMINKYKGNRISLIMVGIYTIVAIIAVISLAFNMDFIVNNLALFVTASIIPGVIFIIFNLKSFVHQFKGIKTFEIIWLLTFLAMLLIVSYMWKDSLFGTMTTILGLLCVVSAARGSRWTFFYGGYNVVFYAIYAYMSNYAGDFMLNAFFYFPMQYIGMYYWAQHYNDEKDVVYKRFFTLKDWIISLLILVVGTLIVGLLMPTINSMLGLEANPAPFIDAFTTTGSIYAQILMTRRFKEQWYVWLIIDVGSLVMWLILRDPAMIIMWTAYLINAVYGIYMWRKN